MVWPHPRDVILYASTKSHRLEYIPLNSLLNLSINWPINTSLIANVAFGKYEVAVL